VQKLLPKGRKEIRSCPEEGWALAGFLPGGKNYFPKTGIFQDLGTEGEPFPEELSPPAKFFPQIFHGLNPSLEIVTEELKYSKYPLFSALSKKLLYGYWARLLFPPVKFYHNSIIPLNVFELCLA